MKLQVHVPKLYIIQGNDVDVCVCSCAKGFLHGGCIWFWPEMTSVCICLNTHTHTLIRQAFPSSDNYLKSVQTEHSMGKQRSKSATECIWEDRKVSREAVSCLHSQLMQIILIIVTQKKGRGAMSTLTSTAVSRKTTRMTVKLPEIRSFWGILRHTDRKEKKTEFELKKKKNFCENSTTLGSHPWLQWTHLITQLVSTQPPAPPIKITSHNVSTF